MHMMTLVDEANLYEESRGSSSRYHLAGAESFSDLFEEAAVDGDGSRRGSSASSQASSSREELTINTSSSASSRKGPTPLDVRMASRRGTISLAAKSGQRSSLLDLMREEKELVHQAQAAAHMKGEILKKRATSSVTLRIAEIPMGDAWSEGSEPLRTYEPHEFRRLVRTLRARAELEGTALTKGVFALELLNTWETLQTNGGAFDVRQAHHSHPLHPCASHHHPIPIPSHTPITAPAHGC